MADASSLLDVEIQCMHEAGIEAPLDLPVKLIQELYPERIVLNNAIRERLTQLNPRVPAIDLFVQNLMEWDYLTRAQHADTMLDPFWSIPAFANTRTLRSRYSSLYFHLQDGANDRKLIAAALPDHALVLSITTHMQRQFREMQANSNDSSQKFFILGILTILLPDRLEQLPSNLRSRLTGLREPTMEIVRKFEEDSAARRSNAQVKVVSA